MKRCGFCGENKSLDQYRMRKTPPIQHYAYCNSCVYHASKNKASYSEDVRVMREKAISMRAFTPDQDKEIYIRVLSGTPRTVIASEHGVSNSCVGKAFKRGRSMEIKEQMKS